MNSKVLGRPKCSKCGRNNHMADKCKFKNAACFSCGKIGHISTVCSLKKANSKPRPVHAVQDVDSEEADMLSDGNFQYSYDLLKLFEVTPVNSVNPVGDFVEPYRVFLHVNGVPIEFELDTGCGSATLTMKDVERLGLSLMPTRVRLANYDKGK